jgi:hypothetical protein
MSVFLAVLVLAHPQPGAAVSDSAGELCPVASDRLNRSVSYRNNPIGAPETAEETAALLMALQSGDGEARTIAIMRLAMAGDLDAFRLLFASADADGLYIYASRYLNSDDTVCIDPEMERAVLAGLRDPKRSRGLVGLLGKNTYRDSRTLQALLEVPFEPTPALANKYLPVGRAITSTHLRGIEADVLAHARGLLPFDTPVKKRVLPGLHQHYAKFFANRRYEPAVAYFREVLVEADRGEPMQSFQIKYGMLRTVVQRALAAIGGADAYAVLISELESIADKPLDPFAASELQNLGKLMVSPTQASELRAIVAAYERMLRTPQATRYDYQMRRTVYAALAELNAAESTALLITELARYMGNAPPPNRDSVIARIFEALANVKDLDIGPLLALVDDFASPSYRRSVWHVAATHPSDTSVDFLLAELRLSVTGGVDAEQLLGRNATRGLLDTLVALESPEYQARARDGIDSLFNEGLLGEQDYVAAVTRLNKTLGNESAFYVAFHAEQLRVRAAEQQARRAAEVAEGKREMQAEFARALARNSTPEGIAANVAMLSAHGSHASRAMEWLVIVGEAALVQLHGALAAVDTEDRHRFKIVNVIGEIGSVSSTAPLIEAAETWANGGFYRPVLFALALIPPTTESIAFANAQLTVGITQRRQVAGLVYLAQIRHAPAADLVAQYTNDALSPRLRSVGLYLGARLGVQGTGAAIEAALQHTTERSERETLLTSLAEAAASPAEFTRVATAAGFTERSFSYRQQLAYCAFRTAADDRKVALAFEVLADNGQWHRREAIRYLIATDPQGTVDRLTGDLGQVLPLNKLLPLSSALQLLLSESRRMGYRLEQTDQGYVLR